MAKIGQEIISQRGIDRDTFCERCGYNLRTLRLIGRCPECGGEYDTRPVNLRGILLPKDLRLPADLIGATVLSGLLAYVILRLAVRYTVLWAHFVGFPFAVMSLLFLFATFRRTRKMLRHHALLRQARRQQGDPP